MNARGATVTAASRLVAPAPLLGGDPLRRSRRTLCAEKALPLPLPPARRRRRAAPTLAQAKRSGSSGGSSGGVWGNQNRLGPAHGNAGGGNDTSMDMETSMLQVHDMSSGPRRQPAAAQWRRVLGQLQYQYFKCAGPCVLMWKARPDCGTPSPCFVGAG